MVDVRTLKTPRPYSIQNAYIALYNPCPDILDGLELFCEPDSVNMFPYRKVMVNKNGLRALFLSACHKKNVGSSAYR